MGKKQQKKSTKEAPAKGKKTKVKADPPSKKEKKQTKKSILDEIEAMSSSDEGSVDQSNAVWNKEAEELKKRIAEGAFESILASKGDKDDEESFEEAVLDDNEEEASDDEEEASADEGSENSEANSESDKDEDDEDGEQEQSKPTKKSKDILVKESSEEEESGGENEEEKEEKEEKEDSEQEDEEDEDEDEDNQQPLFDTNSKALLAKTEEILAERKCFPWIEKFDVIPSTPLPFGAVDEQTGTKIDVHDDLKREVAFYNVALEAVEEARKKCKALNVPFTRPDDFFAEMVKTDEHMARVKDRLIFENKKIEAVAQRKANQEQKLRSKEAHSNKIAEKSRKKKENLKAVDDWAQSAAAKRGGAYDDNVDKTFLKNLTSSSNKKDNKRPWTDRDGNLQSGPNKKRMAADKKYGHGGKRGRFKQNDPRDMNDMSGFNPKGNFAGKGSKKAPGGAGAKRQGKRARDAQRSRGGR